MSPMHDEAPDTGPAVAAGRWRWRAVATVLCGVAGLSLLLASESLEATEIFDFTLHFPGSDKIAHLVQYAVVFFAVWWLLGKLAVRQTARVWAAALIAFLLGLGDELFQRVVAYRSFEFLDMAANGFGVLLGVGLAGVLPSKRMARGAVAVAVIGASALAAYSYRELHHFNRGLLYARQGDLPKALSEYRAALHDGMDGPSFYNELAWIEVESGVGDIRAAVDYGARALAATPHSPDVLDTYGWALHHAGRSREALPLLERAYAGKPKMFCIHYHLGEVYAALGDPARAEFHLREQIRLFPGGSEARRAAVSLRHRGLVVTGTPPVTTGKGS